MKKYKGMKLGVVAVLLLCGVCWAYTADYYHADDAAVVAMPWRRISRTPVGIFGKAWALNALSVAAV